MKRPHSPDSEARPAIATTSEDLPPKAVSNPQSSSNATPNTDPSPIAIPPSTQSEIDGLKTKYKKSGAFDALRKSLFTTYSNSPSNQEFIKQLTEIADKELERDETLKNKERSKAIVLIQGAMERTEIYKDVEKQVDELLKGERERIMEELRTMRGEGRSTKEKKEDNEQDKVEDEADKQETTDVEEKANGEVKKEFVEGKEKEREITSEPQLIEKKSPEQYLKVNDEKEDRIDE